MTKQLRKSCLYCSTKIPFGKRYCYTHYQAELVKFRAKEREYERAVRDWEALPEGERVKANVRAEDSSKTLFAGIAGFSLGGAAWYWLNQTRGIDGLYGVGLVLLGGILAVVIDPVRRLLGHFARALIFAPLYYFVLFIIIWSLSHISVMMETYKILIYAVAIPVCILLSLLIEASGAHTSTGEPKKPSPPSP